MSEGGRGSGGGGGGARASRSAAVLSTTTPSSSLIPNSTKKTIQQIKDITENHSEDEIYAMLKECSMDPNETITKLLLLGTFHEVKRKRDTKKDNLLKERGEFRRKPATQVKTNHSSRPGFLPRHAPHDSRGGRTASERDTGTSKISEKVTVKEMKDASLTAIPVANSSAEYLTPFNGAKKQGHCTDSGTTTLQKEEVHTYTESAAMGKPNQDGDLDSVSLSKSNTSQKLSTACFSAADKVSNMEKKGKISNKSLGYHRANELPHATSASSHSNSVSKPSNYNTRAQLIGAQKAGGNKEWKPKPVAPTFPQGSLESCDSLDEETSNLSKKIEDLHLPPRQHVIIPYHIHVPESERTKLSFGSFDASFGITPIYASAEESEKNSTLSEVTQAEENAEEQSFSNHNEDVAYPDSAQVSGSQNPTIVNSDSYMQDNLVQQQFDPASYYSQYDGRISPLPSGFGTKEVGNSLSIMAQAMNQQSLPVFRPPTGLHISHYPPNYIPYGHYFSPFYPPPGIHQFVSNNSFTQNPQYGNVFPPSSTTPAVKYSFPQNKPSANIPYEDLDPSQTEGTLGWIAAPGREMSTLPSNSFYNIPSQGHPMAFAPPQAAHGGFPNLYHPLLQQSKPMGGAVDMVNTTANAHQSQNQPINWPKTY